VATFKPSTPTGMYNRSNIQSPMALIATGSPKYEVNLLNLDTGNIEILLAVQEAQSNESLS